MDTLRTLYITMLMLVIAQTASPQQHKILDAGIHTLQVVAGNDWLSPPIITLNGTTRINIDFDDLTHVYRRLAYKIAHCDADWQTSTSLFEADYIDGFHSGNIIDDVRESLLTNVDYTHYHFSIPNDHMRLKMSGNYRVTIYDDNDNERPVIEACFMVVDPIIGVELDMTTNTDIDINREHQQIEMQINYHGLKSVFPKDQLRTVVTQNQRWDDARWDAPAQYISHEGLTWTHCPQLIFNAGNEYRKFEILDVDRTAMHVESIHWDGNDYLAALSPDHPRPRYVYDEDANGAFYIRNTDNQDNSHTCEYLLVSFSLPATKPFQGEVYIDGNWTHTFQPSHYTMQYDQSRQTYHNTILLKQGYYSYQYLLRSADGQIAPLPTEGNFFQTQNNYQAYVYYREPGGRTDLLLGYAEIR